MSTAVLFARDPGAANHVVAVAELLGGRLHSDVLRDFIEQTAGGVPAAVVVWGEGPALTVFEAAGIDAAPQSPADIAAAVELLRQASPALLVTGTGDIDDAATRNFWQAARRLGVPSLALLDSARNLELRFNRAQGIHPDRVVAPDSETLSGLDRIGFAPGDVMLVPNLHHARLATLSPPLRETNRKIWNIGPDARVVLFVSENAAEARRMGRPFPINEFALLDGLIADVAASRPIGPMRCDAAETVIVVRPHPRDVPGKYERYTGTAAPRVIISADGTPTEAAAGADLVVGMSSAFLDEASILGRPVHRLG
jgi:hypothetical protein